MSLKRILIELKKEGYSVGIKSLDGQEYIFGGIPVSEGILEIGKEIRITIDNESIYFIKTLGQTFEPMKFNNEKELILFVKEKFPII